MLSSIQIPPPLNLLPLHKDPIQVLLITINQVIMTSLIHLIISGEDKMNQWVITTPTTTTWLLETVLDVGQLLDLLSLLDLRLVQVISCPPCRST